MKRIDFARLNHILIPDTKTGRDRYRRGFWGFVGRPAVKTYRALSMEGRVFMTLWLVLSAVALPVPTYRAYMLWSAVTGVLLVSFLVRGLYRLSNVTLSLEYPPRITVRETMRLYVRVDNHGDKEHECLRIDGPLLPWDGTYVGPPGSVACAPAPGTVRLSISMQFSQRGEHHLDPFHVAKLVPFGLCMGPSLKTTGVRFLVVPRPAKIQRLELAMGPSYQPGGVALASAIGEARELAGLRPYRPGDPVRDLCPRAWARLGTPVVREYQQEYFTRFGVVLDTDAHDLDPEHMEAGISLAAGVIAHLSRTEALIDLLVVGSEVHRLTVGRNLGFVDQALDVLAMVESGSVFEAQRLQHLLAPHLKRLSALVVVALRKDDVRLQFAQQIRSRGLGVRTLVVDAARGIHRHDANLTQVGRPDIEQGALAL